AVLSSQSGVQDRIAVLFDRRGTIVYRTVNPETLIGTPVTQLLAQESAKNTSVVINDVNREGTPVRTVFQRSSLSGCTVAGGVPHRALYAAQRNPLREVLVVGAVFLALSAVIALMSARSIRRSVASLVAGAEALNAPADTPVVVDTRITELTRL